MAGLMNTGGGTKGTYVSFCSFVNSVSWAGNGYHQFAQTTIDLKDKEKCITLKDPYNNKTDLFTCSGNQYGLLSVTPLKDCICIIDSVSEYDNSAVIAANTKLWLTRNSSPRNRILMLYFK